LCPREHRFSVDLRDAQQVGGARGAEGHGGGDDDGLAAPRELQLSGGGDGALGQASARRRAVSRLGVMP